MSAAQIKEEELFDTALAYAFGQKPVHLIELSMRDLSYAIRSKPEWWTKYRDPAIREKWTQEALAQPARAPFMRLKEEHVRYVLDELAEFDAARDPENHSQPSLQRTFWEAEKLVPVLLHEKLVREISKLRDVPDVDKDWHPGSDQQVLDLVHPSMYCTRYGLSQTCDGAAVVPVKIGAMSYEVPVGEHSQVSAWTPTDFKVDSAGSRVMAQSYINNVNPEHQGALHNALTAILARFIPLFSKTLGDLHSHVHRTSVLGDEQSGIDKSGMPINPQTGEPFEEYCHDETWEQSEVDAMNAKAEALRVTDGRTDDFYWEYDGWTPKEYTLWMNDNVGTLYTDPVPGMYVKPDRPLGTGYSLDGRNIQVITRIAEIHLTPEKPAYAGGGWHVEGMLNERIVATALYYLHSDNITESRLSFRLGLDAEDGDMEIPYEQNDPEKLLLRSYGLERDAPANQYLGSFVAREGRAVVFPNLYQHKVEPFSLADPCKPGKRTIVAFFLCDPTMRVLSTCDIPPQQVDWMRDIFYSTSATPSSFLSLPPEIKDRILDTLLADGTLLDRKGADKIRDALMTERSKFVKSQNEAIYEREFSLCEH